MPAIHFYKAASWMVMLEQSGTWCSGEAARLIITPPEWKAVLLKTCPGAGKIFTTRELLTACIEKKQEHGSLVSDQAAAYLLNKIITREAAKYLNIETHHNGYVKALCEFIRDFRQHYPGSLDSFFKNSGKSRLTAKDRDLVDIHKEYESLLGQAQLFDYRSAIEWFAGSPGPGGIAGLPGADELVILWAGFSHISSLDALFFKALLAHCRQAAFLYCENKKAAAPSFRIQDSLLNFFASVKEEFPGSRETLLHPGKSNSLLQLAETLFKNSGKKPAAGKQPGVVITSANNRYDEVMRIARQIREHMDRGMAPAGMRVIFPDYALSTALVLEIFSRYSIPFTLEAGIPLLFFPLAQAVRDLLIHAITPNPFPLREKIFSSPYIGFSCDVDAAALQDFGVQTGAGAFIGKRILASLFPCSRAMELDFESILSRQRTALRTVQPRGKIDALIMVLTFLADYYREQPALRDKLMGKTLADYYVLRQAEKALYAFSRKSDPAEFTSGVRRLLELFAVKANALKGAAGAGDFLIKQDTAVLAALETLLQQWEAGFRELARQHEKLLLPDHVYGFTGLMSDPAAAVPCSEPGGVLITQPATAELTSRPFTWIGGLVDGSFPSLEVFNFLKTRNDGQDLFKRYASIDLCRFQLYQLIAATGERLYLSYPLTDSGKKIKISPFIGELEKWLPAQHRSEAGEAEQLYTAREKLSSLALNVDRNYAAVKKLLKEWKKSDPAFFTHIIALLQSDGLRSSPATFTPFDGLVAHPGALQAVAAGLKKIAPFSVEQLERYAGCPLRFLFDDLMQLKPAYLPDYHPDLADNGKLLKSLLTGYTAEIIGKKVPPGKREKLFRTLAVTTCEALKQESDDLFSDRFKNSLVMGLNHKDPGQARPGLLKAFLEYEQESPDLITPFMAQLSIKHKCGPVHLVMEIERVDCTTDKQFLIVYNYSIANHGNVPAIYKGLSFRLPLQILALRNQLKSGKSGFRVGGAGVYLVKNIRTIKRGGYLALKQLQASRKEKVSEQTPLFSGQRQFGFLDEGSFESILETAEANVKKIRELILLGRFHLPLCAQQDQTCANCRFTRICRIDQLRQDRLYNRLDAENFYKPLRRLQPK